MDKCSRLVDVGDRQTVSAQRQRTRVLLLAAIRQNPGVTRASLGRRTGLSRSAVASGVRALLADGLATEHG